MHGKNVKRGSEKICDDSIIISNKNVAILFIIAKKNNMKINDKCIKTFNNMMCLDIYLSSLTDEEYEKIKYGIKSCNTKILPLISWDIFSDSISMVTTK